MLSGKRRIIVGAAAFSALAGMLAGCSGSVAGLDASAESVGQQVVGFSSGSSDSNGGTGGWSSTLGCPQALKDGFSASLPAGSVVTSLDPSAQSGIGADPGLTAGDIPNCALKFSTNQISLTALVFLNMDDGTSNGIISKLKTDGFVAGPVQQTADGTEQGFSKGALVVEIAATVQDGLSAFAVIG